MKKNYFALICLSFFSICGFNTYAQESNSLLYSQEINSQMGSGSSVASIDGEGYYSGEDVVLDSDANISSITFPGYQFANNLENTYTGAVLYIYENNEGIPNGIPEKSGTPYYSLDLDKTNPLLAMTSGGDYLYEFSVETPDLFLEGGKTYWMVFAVKIDFAEKLDHPEMWNWFNSTTFHFNDAMNIDPDDFFGSGLTYWLSIYDMTGGAFGDDVRGLSFFLYGEEVIMGMEENNFENQIKVFPNPTAHELNMTTPQNLAIDQINIYDVTGRLVQTEYGQSTIDVSNLNDGYFLVEINFLDGVKITKKFIKE
ncbi:T9SS type A sorting domain-containing protein [Aequorivita sp. KMM 9714]|uniref:T9SS type A sorting domain-containing protein n=1 Tax=Aequorivita sp. KMM 9714 TaxID=2707173 RepID=UPI0013EC2AAC|nr:T9SS type A sorting domain-containing protein [Aequorivita sp. KMM 9714]NGX83278.1 T9SS type A sorting domain-containing protein [Aequorivita sp. KMM 9714]